MEDGILARLIADHGRIRAAGNALAAAVAGPPPVDRERFAALRWAFARELLQHMAADEKHVHGPMAASGDLDLRACEARFRQHGEALAAEFQDHVARWPTDKVDANWTAYGRTVASLIARMHERLDMEEQGFYPLAARLDGAEVKALKRNWAGKAWELRPHVLTAR